MITIVKKFDEFINNVSPGDVLFFKDRSIISRAIRSFGTRAKDEKYSWSHCEICVDTYESASFGRVVILCSAREINGGMVELGMLNTYRFKKHNSICISYPKYKSEDQRDLVIKYVLSKCGTKYDYYSVGQKLKRRIVNIFKKDYYGGDNPKKLFCSEVCRDSLFAAGVITHKESHTNPDPTELFAYPELEPAIIHNNNF